MYIEIVTGRIGDGQVLRMPVTQILVCQDNGTPLMVAGEYGPANSQLASMAGLADFNDVLRKLGIDRTVVVDTLKLTKPPVGARLLAGPIPEKHDGR